MKRLQRRPYLTPQPDRIVVEQWLQQVGDGFLPLHERLSGWDPGTDLDVCAEVFVNIDGIYQDCCLERDAQLRVLLLWESSGTKLRGSGSVVEILNTRSSSTITLQTKIDGKLLAGSLKLSIKLLFIDSGSTRQRLIPHTPGSILLETSPYEIQLEGEGARFPIEVIDFTTTHFPHNAGWFLSWDPEDLDQSLLGDVRLYINSRHPQIASAISDLQTEGEGVREAVRLDLAQTLIRGALANEDFVQNAYRYAPGTIGASVRAMIRLYFEGYQFDNIRALLLSPHSFSALLQEKLRIFSND